MLSSDLTEKQLFDVSVIERVSSVLSLIGTVFIALTFICSKQFRRPINRLVFYASMGNIFTNVATIISRDALQKPNGPLCQTQSFLIQMFMPADAFWTLAMAANVWLTFYHKYDAEQLRRLEIYYLGLCYGVPFVPALTFLFITTREKGHVYANATLWCWVGGKWETLRLACFYGPVWLVILATVVIYCRAGKDIYQKRKALRSFKFPASDPVSMIGDPFQSVKTTEVFVTSESVTSSDTVDLQNLAPKGLTPGAPPNNGKSYQVTVTTQSHAQPRHSYQEERISIPERKSSTIGSMSPMQSPTTTNGMANVNRSRRYAAMEANSAAWSYTRVAMLFFLAMMVTWIPSSANRVYSVVHRGEVSLPLQIASAFVLPLQGFWNALIYATTSLPASKKLWSDIKNSKYLAWIRLRNITRAQNKEDSESGRGGPGANHSIETESMTQLQASRPGTKGSNSNCWPNPEPLLNPV